MIWSNVMSTDLSLRISWAQSLFCLFAQPKLCTAFHCHRFLWPNATRYLYISKRDVFIYSCVCVWAGHSMVGPLHLRSPSLIIIILDYYGLFRSLSYPVTHIASYSAAAPSDIPDHTSEWPFWRSQARHFHCQCPVGTNNSFEVVYFDGTAAAIYIYTFLLSFSQHQENINKNGLAG